MAGIFPFLFVNEEGIYLEDNYVYIGSTPCWSTVNPTSMRSSLP